VFRTEQSWPWARACPWAFRMNQESDRHIVPGATGLEPATSCVGRQSNRPNYAPAPRLNCRDNVCFMDASISNHLPLRRALWPHVCQFGWLRGIGKALKPKTVLKICG
jgi:hypothetical protein